MDHLLQNASGGKGSRLKHLPLDLFSHLLLCLAEKGEYCNTSGGEGEGGT